MHIHSQALTTPARPIGALPAHYRAAQPSFGAQASRSEGKGPKVAQIDHFVPVNDNLYDVDGDQVGDLSHGELVERFLKAACPDAQVERFSLTSNRTSEISDQLFELLDRVEAGEKFDGVVLPVGADMSFEDIHADSPVTPENIRQHRAPLLNAFAQHPGMQAVKLAVDFLSELVTHHIPVFISGGNLGSGVFNALNLADGTKNIGATLAEPSQKAYYSADNSLIQQAAQGTFAVTRTTDGFDLTGDGKTDVGRDEVSGGKPLVENFTGKSPHAVKASPEDLQAIIAELESGKGFSRIPLCREKLFSIQELCISILQSHAAGSRSWLEQQGGLSLEKLDLLKPLGEYVCLQGDDLRVFTTKDDKIVYNPDNSGRANAVGQISGTSFAAPYLLGQQLAAQTQGASE